MRILLLGASGFIGRHLCARLLAKGHRVVAAVRRPDSALRRFPGIEAVAVDLNRMTSEADWLPLLEGVEAVVNSAGILQSRAGQSAQAIHSAAPKALFDACKSAGVAKVVQISAVSADRAAGTEYALTKKAADDYLQTLDLDWVVLRPSLVYAQGSYGGSSFLRGLAGLPWLIPLVEAGDQLFQPIHADDLAETVLRAVEDDLFARRVLSPVGPETLSLRSVVEKMRGWLDLPPARFLKVPLPLIRLVARAGDLFGSGPVTSTSLAQILYGNVADPSAFQTAARFSPRSMDAAFAASPSHVQDRWHARLYFLGPLLTLILALLWIGSGLAGLLNPPADAVRVTRALGLPAAAADLFCLMDLILGLLLLSGRARRLLGLFQLAVVAGYTIGIGMIDPALWLDPYGALLKNLPILAAIAAWMALQDGK